ncbi:energy-coupling factor transport system substrate-specific component [Blastococcus colisei]|uniref:Energy-coupling factor transport system substrate-specific component n=1 Tax=Blastococcus colisei TaxID=1564162 RepID=A0A543NU49_9ACTN|nr:ECF transporter S component [Blastococcus colisei]TQN35363.1 energy-coupling factor transport system substrate-specific component [Blastococcus colisei]
MADQAVRPSSVDAGYEKPVRWRTVDIVVTAVLGVAFGVVFWGWNLFAEVVSTPLDFFPPIKGLLNGVFLMPGVVAGLMVRRPGAAIFASTLAAAVSLLLGSPYGGIIVVYGLVQGAGAELGFLLTRYRTFGWGTAILAAVTAGLSTSILDLSLYYPVSGEYPLWAFTLPYTLATVLSSVLLAGVVGLLLVRAMARTGALGSFASGRTRV